MNLVDPSVMGAQFAPQPLDAALDNAVDASRASAFDTALTRQEAAAAAAAPPPPTPVAEADAVDPADRARRTLGLEPEASVAPAANASTGDLILDGLSKLRGNFDASAQKIASVMNGAPVDMEAMLSVQVELARFSLLTDITSKLTGKSTQAFDTLMKGQ